MKRMSFSVTDCCYRFKSIKTENLNNNKKNNSSGLRQLFLVYLYN